MLDTHIKASTDHQLQHDGDDEMQRCAACTHLLASTENCATGKLLSDVGHSNWAR